MNAPKLLETLNELSRIGAVLAALAAAFSMRAAAAQSVWDLSPYRIQVLTAMSNAPDLTTGFKERFQQDLLARSDTVVGAAWAMEVAPAPAEMAARMLTNLDDITRAELPSSTLEFDKIFLLVVQGDGFERRVQARELDGRTHLWSASRTREARQREHLAADAFLTIQNLFSPLAQIEEVDGDQVTLRFRAEGLAPRDPALRWAREGAVYRAVLRVNDRDGAARAVRDVPWTVISTAAVSEETTDFAALTWRVSSGVRSPFSNRRRGRVEQLALQTHPPGAATRLEFVSRTNPDKRLVGYDVYALGAVGAPAVYLGRSDRRGEIFIPPGAASFRELVVKHGGAILARMAIIPGTPPRAVAELVDDDQRLEVEGIVTGLQENLVDLVARRGVLIAEANRRIEDAQWDEAAAAVGKLRQLATRAEFGQTIRQQRQQFVTNDPAVQRKIDLLFTDTEELLGRYLNPADIATLESELLTRRRQAGAGE